MRQHARRTVAAGASLALAAVLASAFASQSGKKLDVSTKALTARAAAYVADYQVKFAFLVGQERYTQKVLSSGLTKQRVMTGELFLTYIPTDRSWVAVHDVAEVDGQPVPDRDNLQGLLKQGEVTRVGQQVLNRNESFNIGNIRRNFNEPTLALLVLEKGRIEQFRFDRRDLSEQAGIQLATLAFTEHDPPVLVRGTDGKPAFSRGELVIETETGRIRHSTIIFRDGTLTATLTTDYELDDRLGLWVPGVFTERYQDTARPLETTTCEATYSNYRRFEVTGRIK